MRELKTVTTATGTKTTKTVWSGAEPTMELDSDGTRYTYLWGPGRLPLALTVQPSTGASETFAYQVDAMGSVIGMTDAAGIVVARYSYDPWGRVTSVSGSDAALAARNPLRYRSYYLDTETGLYYMPARFYDPATYRFLSQDPAPPSAGDPASLNAFAYCQGDPVNLVDPSGATIDVKGDGKLGPEDCLQQMATISGDPARQAAANAAASAASNPTNNAVDIARAARLAIEIVGIDPGALDAVLAGVFDSLFYDPPGSSTFWDGGTQYSLLATGNIGVTGVESWHMGHSLGFLVFGTGGVDNGWMVTCDGRSEFFPEGRHLTGFGGSGGIPKLGGYWYQGPGHIRSGWQNTPSAFAAYGFGLEYQPGLYDGGTTTRVFGFGLGGGFLKYFPD